MIDLYRILQLNKDMIKRATTPHRHVVALSPSRCKLEVLTLVLVIFAALTYIDNHRR